MDCCRLFNIIRHSSHACGIHRMVSERKDVPYAFFYLTALIFYIQYIRSLNNNESNHNSFFKRPATIYIIIFFLSTVLIVAIIIGIFLSGKYRNSLVFGILFFLITIFPVAGFFSFGTVEACERYTYIPYLGFFFIIGQLTENKILLPGLKHNI